MRILVDTGHPAHVHLFKNAIWEWRRRGHDVLITSRDKDVALDLLKAYGLNSICLTRVRKGFVGLVLEQLKRDLSLLSITRRFKPDILIGLSVVITHVGRLIRKPSVVFTDTEHARLSNLVSFPFADTICTPACYEGDMGKKHVRYAGYQELAYLHPNYFQPDPTILTEAGLSEADDFFILRFVSWGASHDVGDHGFSDAKRTVYSLSNYGHVFITSENKFAGELEKYRITIPPHRFHHLLYYAKMYIGESATIASESAMLGVPSLFVSTSRRGYTNELERKYGLVYNFSDPVTAQEEALQKAEALLRDPYLKERWQAKRRAMLSEKIDVTAFIVDFVQRYPQSFREFQTQ